VSGVHYQNLPEWDGYLKPLLEERRLPLGRALRLTPHQRLIREMILQLKRGFLEPQYFQQKFQADILTQWQAQWRTYADQGLLELDGDRIRLTRDGLLRVDALLPAFFEPEHRGVRYT
jgi:oxygen-independent coproporphyrinogen III oxidase